MAPNKKKKKKPAANSARGFATTSTASKQKVQEINDTGEQTEASVVSDENANVPNIDGAYTSSHSEVPVKQIHELSPEELENELDESDLQIVLEKYGDGSKKKASRQLSKMQTERRLLRSQAETLRTSKWLPAELMQKVIDFLKIEDTSNCNRTISCQQPGTNEDDLLARLWTLHLLLSQLGFPAPKTQMALRHLLMNSVSYDFSMKRNQKNAVWGLDECIDWLAQVSDPNVDVNEAKAVPFSFREDELPPLHSGGNGRSNDSVDTSGPETPSNGLSSASRSSASGTDISKDPEDISSESESDLEPDQLVPKYVALQSRLYELDPHLTTNIESGKFAKPARGYRQTGPISSGNCVRISSKMAKIRSDILFDENEAERQLADLHIHQLQHASERRRLNLEERIPSKPGTNKERPPVSPKEEEELEDMLGDLFASVPDSATDQHTGISVLNASRSRDSNIEIREFGKWTGIGPRRILEEACRARDSASKIDYKLVSQSTFSNRHAMQVEWSRDQSKPLTLPISSVSCKSRLRTVRFEMTGVSCPNVAQSEAYISTIALFAIFALSSQEEKVHLRLPPSFRDLWMELLRRRKEEKDAEDRQVLRDLRHLIAECPNHEGGNTTSTSPAETTEENVEPPKRGPLRGETHFDLVNLRKEWAQKASTPSYQAMLPSRRGLPIWFFKDQLLDAIESNQVVIVCGETGCGKSTQVPAYILENELSNGRQCKIYCTEPRRISAISLARRVSQELGERTGDVGTFKSLVGYAIRLESQITAQTRLVYATTGIVMRMLERSDILENITHLLLDEVHERSIDSDFLLIVLKKLLIRRPTLKVVLMSATVDAQKFSKYLAEAPILNVPGRKFPVETRYLEDAIELTSFKASDASQKRHIDEDENEEEVANQYPDRQTPSAITGYSAQTRSTIAELDEYRIQYDLIVKLLEVILVSDAYADYSKAILIFLPGIAEIRRLNDMLHGHNMLGRGCEVHALHSTIATDEQERAFPVPPPGIRKIVLATNIAETGITIPDVTCVIDTGRHKEMRFDERRQLSRLIESFIFKANAKQRRGRAGRVQKGLCFHMFTKQRHDAMPEEQTPEMLRLSLQDLVLRVKICKLGGIEETLSEALDPPSAKNIRRAVDALQDVKALTNGQDLTPLGRQLARLPLDVFLGKLMILGSIFGCLDATLTIAAILSSKSPFSAPMGARAQADVARLAFKKGDSDLLTLYNAYLAWRRICETNVMSEQYFCRKNFLSTQTLSNIEDLKAQLMTSLIDAEFVALNGQETAALNKTRHHHRNHRTFVPIPPRYNSNATSYPVITSLIATAFYPKLLRRDGKGWRNVANNQSISLHPSSVNKNADESVKWLSLYHIMQGGNKAYNAHETTKVEERAVALLCGEAEVKIHSSMLLIDSNRIRFALSNPRESLVLKRLRAELKSIQLLSFRNPGRKLSEREGWWMDVLREIMVAGDKEVEGTLLGTGAAQGKV